MSALLSLLLAAAPGAHAPAPSAAWRACVEGAADRAMAMGQPPQDVFAEAMAGCEPEQAAMRRPWARRWGGAWADRMIGQARDHFGRVYIESRRDHPDPVFAARVDPAGFAWLYCTAAYANQYRDRHRHSSELPDAVVTVAFEQCRATEARYRAVLVAHWPAARADARLEETRRTIRARQTAADAH